MRRGFAQTAVVFAFVLSVGLSGCTSESGESDESAGPGESAAIEVTELDGVFEPLSIKVTGLPAGESVDFTANTLMSRTLYMSAASFVVDENGTIDLAKDAPTSGDWVGADAMAPFSSMFPSTTPSASEVEAIVASWDEPRAVNLAVVDDNGDELAQTVVNRPGMAPGIETREVKEPGIDGVYAVPASKAAGSSTSDPKPAVLVFTGSDGGLESAAMTARILAGLGYPALGISYFGREGQPEQLENVPVETFETGLAWLREQPEVDVAKVKTFGISRGGEMALWLAAEYPDQVAGAIAPVGAGTIVCGYPTGTAWTRGGKPLVERCSSTVVGVPMTQIDVAAINGPVVLACGTDDELWNSCAALDDIVERRGSDAKTLATRGDQARHSVTFPPYLPLWLGSETTLEQVAATRAAQEQFWSDVVSILDD